MVENEQPYLIDLGMVKVIDSPDEEIKEEHDLDPEGCSMFMSTWTQKGVSQSYRDDLMSLGFAVLWMIDFFEPSELWFHDLFLQRDNHE